MHTTASAPPFRSCTKCGHVWEDVQAFIEDPNLKLNGYLPDFSQPGNGLIIVTHKTPACGSSFSLRVDLFRHMYQEQESADHHATPDGCEGRCFIYDDFSKCGSPCDMRWIRDLMLLISSNAFPAALIDKIHAHAIR